MDVSRGLAGTSRQLNILGLSPSVVILGLSRVGVVTKQAGDRRVKESKGGEGREMAREGRRKPALSKSVWWGKGRGSRLCPHEALGCAMLAESMRGMCVHLRRSSRFLHQTHFPPPMQRLTAAAAERTHEPQHTAAIRSA